MYLLTDQTERRVLVQFRADPDVVPVGIRPVIVRGQAIAGVLVDRVSALRPLGLSCERLSYFWLTMPRDSRQTEPARWVWHQVTNSRVDSLLTGSFSMRRGELDVAESDEQIAIRCQESRSAPPFYLQARVCAIWPGGSVFDDVEQAARTLGPSHDCWDVVPLWVDKLQPGALGDPSVIPPGSWTLDSAILARRVVVGRCSQTELQPALRLMPQMPLATWSLLRQRTRQVSNCASSG
jgi:hypothetical protein